MPIGEKNKNGVIIKCPVGFNYYHTQNDEGLRPLFNPSTSRANNRVKTLKVDRVVEVANNKVSVRVHPDGNIEITPNVK